MASSSAVEDEQLSDTDSDEENAHKEEQCQEEQRVVTPRPTYSDEELHRLVEYVQRMTILHSMSQRSWNENALDMIRRWLLEVNEPLLTISYNGIQLTACLGFPETPVGDLSYFVRSSNEIFTVDEFHDEITFGNMHNDVDGCLLRVLELFYAPIFRDYTEWSENVKRRFCKAMDTFLTYLTGTHSKMAGMAVLYVPHVPLQLERKGIAFDTEFVKCLESITVYWTTQIRTLLQDRTLIVPNELATVADEYAFWQYRAEILQGLNTQLAQTDLQRILKVLRQAKSVHMRQIDDLIVQAKQELEEAISNIKFLHLLIRPCELINMAESPAAVAPLVPRIVHLIRFIWLNSERYNTRHLITGLFRNLSNQIIQFCTEQTNVQKILEGNSRFGIRMCNMSIDCCLTYKIIYEQLAQQHSLRDAKLGWELDNAIIFNHVDAFIERLNDVIDICESMIVFGRLDETEGIEKPAFGGTSGSEFEKISDRVESQFLSMLTTLRTGSQQQILNVHKSKWYAEVAIYRRTLQTMEETLQRLISNIFQHVCNVEDAIEALNVMLYFSYRAALRKVYLRQVSYVWLMFSSEMDETARQLRERKQQHESWLPYYASRALGYRINLARLSWLCERLSAAEWLPTVPEAATVLLKYESLAKDFEREARQAYIDWQQSCNAAALSQKLQHYLLVRSKQKKGLLECNMDACLLAACTEAQHFEQLGFAVPLPLRKLYERRLALHCLYNGVLQVCLDYNRSLAALAERERKLFQPLIQRCDRQLAPAIYKLTYGSELSDNYLPDCMQQLDALQQTVQLYKRAIRHIARNCERICDTPMLQLSGKSAVAMCVFQQQLSTHMREITVELHGYYNSILQLLEVLQHELEPVPTQLPQEWHNLVQSFDDMLANALLTSARNSLRLLYNALHCQEHMVAAPMLVIESDIQQRQVVLTPDMAVIATVLGDFITDNIHNILAQFSRLSHKLKLPKQLQLPTFPQLFRADAACQELIRGLEAEIGFEREEIARYLGHWLEHRALWETTETDFIERMQATPMTADVFEAAIEHYSAVADDIAAENALANVHFILVNQNALRGALLDWIEKWQALNIKILLEHATALIQDVYAYMERNEHQVMRVPRTLKETAAAKQYLEQLVQQVSYRQRSFAAMIELFVLLHKYRVPLTQATQQQITGLEQAWLNYLKTLSEADEMLDNESECEDTKQTLLQQADAFKHSLKQFNDEFFAKLQSVVD